MSKRLIAFLFCLLAGPGFAATSKPAAKVANVENETVTITVGDETVFISADTLRIEKTTEGHPYYRITVAHAPSGNVLDLLLLVSQCSQKKGVALIVEPGTFLVLGRFEYAEAPDAGLEATVALAACRIGAAKGLKLV